MKRVLTGFLLAGMLAFNVAAQVTTNPSVTGAFNPASPGPIGATTPGAATFTSVTLGTGTALSSYIENTFTVTPTNLTVVGTPTYTGVYTKIGRVVFVQYRIQSTTSTASTAGSTLLNLPINSSGAGATCSAVSNSTSASFGVGLVGTTVAAPPTWGANADVYVSCQYFT